jgi:hypothetical protein
MVFNMTHLRIYGRKIISRHIQLVGISYRKLYFHRISRFSAVFIINNLNASKYKSGTMNTKSLFRLSFNRSDKKTRNISIGLFRISFFVRVYFENVRFYKCYENTINVLISSNKNTIRNSNGIIVNTKLKDLPILDFS